jgi:hypothetical protein
MTGRRARRPLAALAVAFLLLAAAPAPANPLPRFDRTVEGDFLVIGSSIGFDCGSAVGAPAGASTTCGTLFDADSAFDAVWADNTAAGGAASDGRSSATLELPADANVLRAQLYWAGLVAGLVGDGSALIDRPNNISQNIPDGEVQVQSFPSGLGSASAYQATAEVTALVRSLRAGAYRVTGIDARLQGLAADELSFGGWVLVVVYERPGAARRRISLHDGLTTVAPGSSAAATVRGLTLAPGAPAGSLGVWGFEGDIGQSGDRITVDGTPVPTSMQNPDTNFFNSSRTRFGLPVAGAVPALTGAADTLAGVDLDVVDISNVIQPGVTELTIGAATTDDAFWLGGLVLSVEVPPLPDAAAPPDPDAGPEDGPTADGSGDPDAPSDGAPAPDVDARDSAPTPDAGLAPDGAAPAEEAGVAGDDAGTGRSIRTVLGGSGCACRAGGQAPSGVASLLGAAALAVALRRRFRTGRSGRRDPAGSGPAPARTP